MIFKKYAMLHWLWFWVACNFVMGIAGILQSGGNVKTFVIVVESSLIMTKYVLYSGFAIILVAWCIRKVVHIVRIKINRYGNRAIQEKLDA